jgi:hypothetical protein
LINDRDVIFHAGFDEVFAAVVIEVIRIAPRSRAARVECECLLTARAVESTVGCALTPAALGSAAAVAPNSTRSPAAARAIARGRRKG